MNSIRYTASILLSAAMLGGCASSDQYSRYPVSQPYPAQTYPAQTYPASSPSYSNTTGTIESIQLRQGTGEGGVGVGAVVGGVVGGLLGNQVGGGTGKKAATVAGVIGGAMVGHEMERNGKTHNAYQIGVRLDNGSYQTLTQDDVAQLQVGSRVRVENQRVYRY